VIHRIGVVGYKIPGNFGTASRCRNVCTKISRHAGKLPRRHNKATLYALHWFCLRLFNDVVSGTHDHSLPFLPNPLHFITNQSFFHLRYSHIWARHVARMPKCYTHTHIFEIPSKGGYCCIATHFFMAQQFSPPPPPHPSGPGPPHYSGYMMILRHTILNRTPLNERSARRRGLCLKIHNTLKRKVSMQPGWIRTPPKPASDRTADGALLNVDRIVL
jgi:hypothetical protein